MTITPEWLSDIKQIAENAEQGPYMGLSNEEVLSLVAAAGAGARDTARLDALNREVATWDEEDGEIRIDVPPGRIVYESGLLRGAADAILAAEEGQA